MRLWFGSFSMCPSLHSIPPYIINTTLNKSLAISLMYAPDYGVQGDYRKLGVGLMGLHAYGSHE